MKELATGFITGVSGPIVAAKAEFGVRMFEAVRIGRLLGEIVRIRGEEVDIQTYGDTTGLSVGEEVFFTGELLSVDLGPGFLGEILDGTGRSLRKLAKEGIYLEQRQKMSASPDEKLWRFTPSAVKGDTVVPGDILGMVIEGNNFL
ncbi:MAG: V-type ATP synthase subunit A, partial [Synergistaceae bacterium]|nr:V-type ATP synthase subunit A [Synergistaceae bacterium]